MAQCAPAAIALAKSPENLIPPSAMTTCPVFAAASAQSRIAVICGTPTPATIRVVQIDPGPIPTFTASAPGVDQRPRPLGGRHVARHDLHRVRVRASAAPPPRPRSSNARAPCRSPPRRRRPRPAPPTARSPASPTVEAAATRSRPSSSLAASGFSTACSVSLSVRSPVSRPPWSTTSSFSIRRASIIPLASPRSAGSRSMARFSLVIIALHRRRVVAGEAHVAVGDDPEHHAPLVHHRKAGDPVALLQRLGVLQRLVGPQRHRRIDHARDEALHPLHLRRLRLDVEVAVDHPDAARLRHGDRHARLGHRVHRGADQRDVQRDRPRSAACGCPPAPGSTSEAPGTSSTSSKVSASRSSIARASTPPVRPVLFHAAREKESPSRAPRLGVPRHAPAIGPAQGRPSGRAAEPGGDQVLLRGILPARRRLDVRDLGEGPVAAPAPAPPPPRRPAPWRRRSPPGSSTSMANSAAASHERHDPQVVGRRMPRGRRRHVREHHVRRPAEPAAHRRVRPLGEEVELDAARPPGSAPPAAGRCRAPARPACPLRSPSAFTRATATCVQPPGAQPRSTTRAPGFRKPNRSSISTSLKAARLR